MIFEMDAGGLQMIGAKGTPDTAFSPAGAHHKMFDEELRASCEQVGQGLFAVWRIEDVFLSTRTQGKVRRSALSWSRMRVNAFSFWRRSRRAFNHCSLETTGLCVMNVFSIFKLF